MILGQGRKCGMAPGDIDSGKPLGEEEELSAHIPGPPVSIKGALDLVYLAKTKTTPIIRVSGKPADEKRKRRVADMYILLRNRIRLSFLYEDEKFCHLPLHLGFWHISADRFRRLSAKCTLTKVSVRILLSGAYCSSTSGFFHPSNSHTERIPGTSLPIVTSSVLLDKVEAEGLHVVAAPDQACRQA